jgi:hypothetical protein
VAVSYEHGNKTSDSLEGAEYFDLPRDYQLLSKVSAAGNYFAVRKI